MPQKITNGPKWRRGYQALLISFLVLGFALAPAPTSAHPDGTIRCTRSVDELDRLLATLDLATTEDLTRALGCRDDRPCTVLKVLQQIASEKKIPLALVLSVAWTESSWHQWDSKNKVLTSGTGDYGLMQINKKTWKSKYKWKNIEGDLLYNARAGGDILAWSYNYARKKGYSGKDLLQATYAVYNGGPKALKRPWNESSPFRKHDINFLGHLNKTPWAKSVKEC